VRPGELAKTAAEVGHLYPDAIIFAPTRESPLPPGVERREVALLVDVDRVWPDCSVITLCERAGEYRTIAWIDNLEGKLHWLPQPWPTHEEDEA
jgi:hypothetical protein